MIVQYIGNVVKPCILWPSRDECRANMPSALKITPMLEEYLSAWKFQFKNIDDFCETISAASKFITGRCFKTFRQQSFKLINEKTFI
jgi:hypothetical protein